MSAGQDGSGWVRDPGTPYHVSRVKIAEFAAAIGDPNPVYRDPAAARQAGYPDVIAPPTFAVVLVLPSTLAAARGAVPAAGSSAIVHVEQHFRYARPIRAGDVLHAETTVTRVQDMRGTTVITTRTEILAADGEPVCTADMTLAQLPGDGAAGQPPAG